jgi:hypothetical protein
MTSSGRIIRLTMEAHFMPEPLVPEPDEADVELAADRRRCGEELVSLCL